MPAEGGAAAEPPAPVGGLPPDSTDPDNSPADGPRFAPWFGALAVRLPLVVREHLPGRPLDARRRQLVSVVAAEAAGSHLLGSLHAAWHGVLGPAELSEADDELLAWVAAGVAELPRFDAWRLPSELPPAAQEAVAATVAHAVVVAIAFDRLGSAAGRLTGKRPMSASGLFADVTSALVALPVALPVVVAGVGAGLVGRLAPGPVTVEVDPNANLLAQLLAETLPTWLGSAWGRTLVAGLPVEVPVAVRSGQSAATVRVGRGKARVADGVASDVWALFDGDVDGLLRAGTQSLSRELRAVRLRG